MIEGRKRTYIVDCVRLMADGGIEVVEVKGDPRALQDQDYAEKLQAVRRICEQVGWRFRVVFKKALTEPAALHGNVTDVQSWRMTDHEFGFISDGAPRAAASDERLGD